MVDMTDVDSPLYSPPRPDFGLLLWNGQQVSEATSVPVRTLERWRHRRTGPQYVKLPNGSVRYRPQDILTWLDQRLVPPMR